MPLEVGVCSPCGKAPPVRSRFFSQLTRPRQRVWPLPGTQGLPYVATVRDLAGRIADVKAEARAPTSEADATEGIFRPPALDPRVGAQVRVLFRPAPT
eukprot:scaffold10416_cov32-Tisochrysis_lutea.AAC.4